MKKLFAHARVEALYRQLFDTPERRALLGEFVRAVLATDPSLGAALASTRATVAAGWDGRRIGHGERHTPAQMEAARWWSDRALVWSVAATASTTYGTGWTADGVVGPPTMFPAHGDSRGTWAPREQRGGVQWLELSFPANAPAAVGLRVFETFAPGAVYALTDEDAGPDAAPLWQQDPTADAAEARVLDVTLDPPRRLRRVRLWLDTDVSADWNEIDAVALVAERVVVKGAVDWRHGHGVKSKPKRTKKTVAPEVDPAGAKVGVGTRLTAATGLARLQQESAAWRWPVGASASSTYGGGWSPSAVVGPPTVFPKHGDYQGAWAPRAAGEGAQWLEVSFAEDATTAIEEVLVFETNLPGALYAVVAQEADGSSETLWQRPPKALAAVAKVLSVKVERPRAVKTLRLWVDTDAVSSWPEIDAVALVPLVRRN